ncbi:hypothetical protein [Alloprevotella tannerae]
MITDLEKYLAITAIESIGLEVTDKHIGLFFMGYGAGRSAENREK